MYKLTCARRVSFFCYCDAYSNRASFWFVSWYCLFVFFAGRDLWLDILTIALGQATEGGWYASTLQLQLVSFEACVACRGVRSLLVTVDTHMPLTLWGNDDSVDDPLKAQAKRRRLPALRAAGALWTLPSSMFAPILLQAALLKDVEWMQKTGVNYVRSHSKVDALSRGGDSLHLVSRVLGSPRIFFETMLTLIISKEHDAGTDTQSSPRVFWPTALRQLSIGCTSTERVDWLALPNSLERLALGGCFDQPIESVAWPASLKQLTLGGCFDQPIADVVWPASLLQLTFGVSFNQPISHVNWPASLLHLTFEGRFDQPIADVVWPTFLEHLAFGYSFNQPIADVVWPSTLQKLAFGGSFDQPIAGVVWPASLNRLVFGDDFNHSINRVAWPSALQYLSFGTGFVQPIEGTVWPPSLRCLAFSNEFLPSNTALAWPPFQKPLICTSCDALGQPVEPFDWPPGIDLFDQPNMMWVINL